MCVQMYRILQKAIEFWKDLLILESIQKVIIFLSFCKRNRKEHGGILRIHILWILQNQICILKRKDSIITWAEPNADMSLRCLDTVT